MEASLDLDRIRAQVALALDEDLGDGDLTAELLPLSAESGAMVISREECILCGIPWFDEVYRQLDEKVSVKWFVADGDRIIPDTRLCELRGNSRALLSGERTALNYLQTLSATSTRANQYARAVEGTGVRVLDTRKTIPGLRYQQKYAVRCGGCHNHRIGLFDAVLIKENHIQASGSIREVLRLAATQMEGACVEIEVENFKQLDEALESGATHVLLDNFSNEQLSQAVSFTAGRARLEASGNVTLETIRDRALTGVDDISVGDLTKNLQAVDLSMQFFAL